MSIERFFAWFRGSCLIIIQQIASTGRRRVRFAEHDLSLFAPPTDTLHTDIYRFVCILSKHSLRYPSRSTNNNDKQHPKRETRIGCVSFSATQSRSPPNDWQPSPIRPANCSQQHGRRRCTIFTGLFYHWLWEMWNFDHDALAGGSWRDSKFSYRNLGSYGLSTG